MILVFMRLKSIHTIKQRSLQSSKNCLFFYRIPVIKIDYICYMYNRYDHNKTIMNLSTVLNKFQTSTIAGINGLIDGSAIWKTYKQIRGNSRKTLIDFVTDNQLKYVIISRSGKKLNISIDDYNHRSHYIKIYPEDIVTIDELEPIITALPDIITDKQPKVDKDNRIQRNSDTNVSNKPIAIIESEVVEEKVPAINMNIIQLADHEQFKDSNGNVFEIEVRGERHSDKLFLKCMHVEEYFGIDRLTENLLRKENTYIENVDYIIITSFNRLQYRELKEISSSNQVQLNRLKETTSSNRFPLEPVRRTKKSSVYLTFIGFLRVILASRTGNENLKLALAWVVRLTFTSAFGSNDERLTLANELTLYSKCLTNLSGIYLIKIGKVKELRESMNVPRELYPDDNAIIYKFGRSRDILKRYVQHCSQVKYGKYNNKIELTWFIPIPEHLLADAESDVFGYFKNNNLLFEFKDASGMDHKELIVVNDSIKYIKTKYMQLGKDYPSSGKDLIDIWRTTVDETKKELANKQHEIEIMQLEFANQLKDKAIEINTLEYENQLKDKTIESKDKDIRLLQMEMQLIKLTN